MRNEKPSDCGVISAYFPSPIPLQDEASSGASARRVLPDAVGHGLLQVVRLPLQVLLACLNLIEIQSLLTLIFLNMAGHYANIPIYPHVTCHNGKGRCYNFDPFLSSIPKPIENVVKYVWSMQSVNPAVQNVGPVGWC